MYTIFNNYKRLLRYLFWHIYFVYLFSYLVIYFDLKYPCFTIFYMWIACRQFFCFNYYYKAFFCLFVIYCRGILFIYIDHNWTFCVDVLKGSVQLSNILLAWHLMFHIVGKVLHLKEMLSSSNTWNSIQENEDGLAKNF